MYMILAVTFVEIFFDIDPTKSFPLRQAANGAATKLGALIEANVKGVKATGLVAGVTDKLMESHNPLKDYGVHMVRQLLNSGLSTYDVAWSQMLPTAGAMVANQGQVVSALHETVRGDVDFISLRNPWITTLEKGSNTSPKLTGWQNSTLQKQMMFSSTTRWKVSASREPLDCIAKQRLLT